MDPKDINKMAFVTHQGLFWFTVMSFGLCNAPATFEWVMELFSSDCPQLEDLSDLFGRCYCLWWKLL